MHQLSIGSSSLAFFSSFEWGGVFFSIYFAAVLSCAYCEVPFPKLPRLSENCNWGGGGGYPLHLLLLTSGCVHKSLKRTDPLPSMQSEKQSVQETLSTQLRAQQVRELSNGHGDLSLGGEDGGGVKRSRSGCTHVLKA